jgi:phosphoribosylformylglycinamidine (FGAM) synthase-like amidotransferase family enzyme
MQQSETVTCSITTGFQVELKLNWTHQMLVYNDDINLLGKNIHTTQKTTQSFIDASKEVGLEVNAQETKYMLLSHYQNAEQNHGIKIANRYTENVAQVKKSGTNINKSKLNLEEIKSILNSSNACYHSVQILLACCLKT